MSLLSFTTMMAEMAITTPENCMLDQRYTEIKRLVLYFTFITIN